MKSDRHSAHQLSYQIVLVYLLLSSLWILLSDRVLGILTDDSTTLTHWQTVKGWVFVLFTSALLYLLIRLNLRSLEKAERKYRSIFENAAEGIYQVTPEGYYISANPALAEIYGYRAPEELFDLNWWQLNVEPNRRTEFLRELQQTGNVVGFQSQVYRADGTRIWTTENTRAVRDRKGTLVYYEGTVEDITDRVVATSALHKTYSLLNAIIEGTTDAVFVKDRKGRYLLVNTALTILLGKSMREIIGKSNADLFGAEKAREIQETEAEIIESGETRTYEKVTEFQNKKRTFWVTKGVYRDSEGNPMGLIGILRDISDRFQAETALAETKEKLEAVIRAAPVAIDMISPEGKVLIWNRAAARIFGWSAREAIGAVLPIVDRQNPEQQEQFLAWLDSLNQGATFTDLETRRRCKDGTEIVVNLSAAPVRDANGEIIGAMEILADISDRKRLQGERDRLIARLQRETEDLTALSLVTADSTSTLKLSQLFNVMLSRIVEVMQADAAVILLKEDNHLHQSASVGIDSDALDTYKVAIGECFAGRIAATLHPLYVPDATEDPRITSDFIAQRQVCTLLGVPLKHNGDPIGVIQVEWRNFHQLSDREIHLLETTAERCTMGILNAQLYEQTKQLHDRLRLQINEMPSGCIVVDSQWRFTDWNPAARRIFGYTAEEIIGESYEALVPPNARAQVAEILEQLVENRVPIHSVNKNLTKDGRTIICEWYNTALFHADGSFHGLLAMVQDITERKRAEDALQASEAELRALFAAMTDVIFSIDLQGRYLKIAPTNPHLLYEPPQELLGKTLHEVFDRPLADRFLGYIQQAIAAQETREFEYSLPINGSVVWFATKISPMSDHAAIWVARDITDRKTAEAQLKHYAFFDSLTGLPNRTFLSDRLAELINAETAVPPTTDTDELNPSPSPCFAVLLLNLDRFRAIKYSLGHLVGDRLLLTTAQRLRACLRPTDLLARMGGDEFAIVLENIRDVSDAQQIAERIHSSMRFPFNLEEHEVFSTMSIGIAVNTCEYHRPEDILRDADTALHYAKKQGHGRSVVFARDMHAHAIARLQLETDLQRAIDLEQFQVFYQPIVSLSTRQLAGFEALVRWNHPRRGRVSPAEFIPLAEETGSIVAIDRWVVREACTQLAQWQARYPAAASLTMSVNLSGVNFSQVGTIERLDRILREIGIEGRFLKLEITESVIMENPTSALPMLEQLKSLGIQLSIDDFGTGYSSLSRLHQLPLDTLKIDREFVKDMKGLDDSAQIVQTIVTLAHSLGMDAIAEGIETPQQLELLRTLECDYGQGYFFAPPLERDAALNLLRSDTLFRDNG
ncbi:PAS domain S-box protein [Phormidium sp. CCY1219]|uniref:PAS domain S-box protein n=1 Tax=Phormidium sp. CCY1219 TaxID=2886104 RepID=UPI002D1ED797|nr:PAS domain S-box protein [Phormidium sp. CCY1219]MEB3827699.1 PAS domain S-box protein [Phormidium sp. CCY1219]